ncbi:MULTISPECIES: hypothetical protein [Pseudomonas]|uniref:Uncharacterized protein n=1 Tax=Pseudomonas chlororaphis TaxID=587753 RepID=A0AAP9VUT3_9PSED|nr:MULTISPECIES: hypothetical protein [Pseudomonas]QNR47766.1 hypothetical protein HLB40_29675 [Pseudomonas chlororaphis]
MLSEWVFSKALMRSLFLVVLVLSEVSCTKENAVGDSFKAITYEEALQKFNEAHEDENYRCQYSLVGMSEDAPLAAVEIEDFLYLKLSGSIIELMSRGRGEDFGNYGSESEGVKFSYKVLRKYNVSEYQESDDRDVEVEFSYRGKSEVLKMYGFGCGI